MAPKDPFTQIIGQRQRDSQLRLAKPDPDDDADGEEFLDPRQYQAVETGPKPARLVIQCSEGPSHAPAYPLLVNVIFDRRFGGSFVLVFNFMVITITGRNLGPVVHAITRHRAMAITQFDPQAHDAPAADASVITGIEVQAGEAMEEQIESIATAGQKVG